MDIAEGPFRVTALRILLAGIGVAFAFLLLTLVTGMGSDQARADGGESTEGATSGLVSASAAGAVDGTLVGVTTVVQEAAQAVASVATIAVEAAPPPVSAVVEPVAAVTTTVVARAVEPVAEVVDAGVVSPAVEVAAAVPVVGDVVRSGGLDEELTDAAASVDRAASRVVGSLVAATSGLEAVPPRLDVPGSLPGFVPAISSLGLPLSALVVFEQAAVAPVRAFSSAWTAAFSPDPSPLVVLSAVAGAGGLLSSAVRLGVCAPGGGVPPGSGGAGPSALGLAAFAPLAAHRAWVRRRGPSDDDAPPAPVLGTDVSPD